MSEQPLTAGAAPVSTGERAGLAPAAAAAGVALLAVLAWAYAPIAGWIWMGWTENPYFTHGPLVPLIAGWLVWRNREALATTPWRTFWPGLAILLLAGAVYVLGFVRDYNVLVAGSGVVALHGLVLTLGGPAVYRLLAFPLFFLLFGVPVSQQLIYEYAFPLQLISAKLAVVAMNLLTGADVEAVGTVMRMDGRDYVVAAECSGFKALLGLLLLGLLVAHLTDTTRWRKVAILALALPIAVLANVTRLVLILCAGRMWSHEFAVGAFHDFSGLPMIVVALGLLLAAARGVVGPEIEIAGAAPARSSGLRQWGLRWQPLAAAAAVLAVVAGTGQALAPPPPEVPDVDLEQVPMAFGEWEGEALPIDDEVYSELGNVAIIQRMYRDKPGRLPVQMIVICGRGRRSLHSPTTCYRGAGNEFLDQRDVELKVGDDVINARQLIVTDEGTPRLLSIYTYTDGEVTTTDWTTYTGQSAAQRGVVWTQIHFAVPWEGNVPETAERLQRFVEDAWPAIDHVLADLVPSA